MDIVPERFQNSNFLSKLDFRFLEYSRTQVMKFVIDIECERHWKPHSSNHHHQSRIADYYRAGLK